MRRVCILFALIMVICTGYAVADSRIQQVSPAVYADMELPFRCVLPGSDKQISKTIVLTPEDFSFIPLQRGDELPRYAVNDYSFHRQPADKILTTLLKSADISVVAPKSEYALLAGTRVSGELSDVVAQLAEAGDVFYNYNANKKRLLLLRRADYFLTVPSYKPILMTVLDALRGSGIENLTVDWESYRIRMTISPEELQKAKKLIQQMLNESYLLVADIEGYQAIPYTIEGTWQSVLNESVDVLASTGRAVVGRYVVLKTRITTQDFLNKVSSAFQLNRLVEGQAFVPNGWQMKFNINECVKNGTLPYPGMSIVMKTKIQNGTEENTKITLHTENGTLTSFNINSQLNQEVVLVGIPSKIGNSELLFTLKFGLVRFIKKGE